MTVESVAQQAQTVKRTRGRTSAAERALRAECRQAHAAGESIAALARAAGVTRATMYAWLREEV